MAEPIVATVFYHPENESGAKVSVKPEPIQVPPGIHDLVWNQEEAPTVPWSFVGIEFDRQGIINSVNIQDRVITGVDDNETEGHHGTIKYTLTIRDEQSRQLIIQDPEIENEFGGVDPD